MGNLTDDMTRLSEEVVALRSARADFMKDLKSSVASMLAAFSAAEVEMARKTISDLVAFVSGVKKSVASMLADFSAAEVDMARKTKSDRMAFVSGMKRTVASMRKENAADLAGAHRAWYGPHAERKAEELKAKAEKTGQKTKAEPKGKRANNKANSGKLS